MNTVSHLDKFPFRWIISSSFCWMRFSHWAIWMFFSSICWQYLWFSACNQYSKARHYFCFYVRYARDHNIMIILHAKTYNLTAICVFIYQFQTHTPLHILYTHRNFNCLQGQPYHSYRFISLSESSYDTPTPYLQPWFNDYFSDYCDEWLPLTVWVCSAGQPPSPAQSPAVISPPVTPDSHSGWENVSLWLKFSYHSSLLINVYSTLADNTQHKTK